MVLAVSDGELTSTAGSQGQSEGRGSSLSIHSLPSGPSSPFSTEDQPVASWALSFERLLQDPLGLAYFTEFLKKEFSAENVTFWKACERFQQIPASDTKQLSQEAHNIYHEFLSSQALSPVNIDRQAWLSEEVLAQPRPDMFRAQQLQSHRKSLGSAEGESESRPGKYCCVYLPDGTASLALARPGLTIRDMLAGICEKRGLSLPDIKVYLVGNEQKALVLDQDCTVLADQEVRLESRITFHSRVLYRLEFANLERVVRISAKPTKRLQEALQPILEKHGLSLEQVVLHRPGEKQLLDLEKLVSSVASQTLVLDILPGAKMREASSTSPCRSQGCLPRTQDKGTHLPPLPPSLLVEDASSSTGKRQTCDIEGLVELLNRVQSSGAHDQRGLLRKEDLVSATGTEFGYSDKNCNPRPGEMAPWFRALAALPEHLGLILSTHVAAHTHL
ncbi:regulator of G-protein signaling 14-like protein [Cricetulus griseus]|uniref:Regulator of G-protein signaling 14 n=1 Tax=Cricetulus griseus TaxID=10029 RepID=A0A061IEG3_CRIGR|nr:regulator of G-protein signaling 14-like protein [Cricetulus griseus]